MELGGLREPPVNFNLKNIRQFTPDDTIILVRRESTQDRFYYCQFVNFERGMVYGKVLLRESSGSKKTRNYMEYCEMQVGDIIRARVARCLLWGQHPDSSLHYNHCLWFDTKTGVIKP